MLKNLNTSYTYSWKKRYLNLVYIYTFFSSFPNLMPKTGDLAFPKPLSYLCISFLLRYIFLNDAISAKYIKYRTYTTLVVVYRETSFYFCSRNLGSVLMYGRLLLLFIQLKVFFRLWTLYTTKIPLRHVFQSFCQMLM